MTNPEAHHSPAHSEIPVTMGDVLFQSPQVIADPDGFIESGACSQEVLESFTSAFTTPPGNLSGPGTAAAEALFVLDVDQDEGAVIAVKLGVMSSEAAGNHFPDLADKLTKPKVLFIGGHMEPVVLAVGLVDTDVALDVPHRFGDEGQFLIMQTGESAPSVDEQVQAVTPDGAAPVLRGMRLFHSYVTFDAQAVNGWLDSGLVQSQPAKSQDVFSARPGETWRGIMRRRPFPENLFSTWALYPERN